MFECRCVLWHADVDVGRRHAFKRTDMLKVCVASELLAWDFGCRHVLSMLEGI